MQLLERERFFLLLNAEFKKAAEGEGHCILVSGEAGIGKTSLVNAFCKEVKETARVYKGICDAFFTPRPLGPFFDILWQLKKPQSESDINYSERPALFTNFYYELASQKSSTVILIEDIHWADEATLDFIKFLTRRITGIPCLLILTYRDDEITTEHPLRSVLGQLPTDLFTRLRLTPLSREVVAKLALRKGYKGEDVFAVSGGNPFYVNEILASYSTGIPDNIKDSILSVYNRQNKETREVWQLLSVAPTGVEKELLEKIDQEYLTVAYNGLDSKILIINRGLVSFKHELYRRTIETFLSPILRVDLNKKILELLLKYSQKGKQIERIVHHAKNANEFAIVVQYAPLAAKQAASVGAHIEAAKLFFSAIEYYQDNDKKLLIDFYQNYAYECYLTNQIGEAIIYSEKSLNILKEESDTEKTGTCMRFLSRLWWFAGSRKKAEDYAGQSIEVMVHQLPSKGKAMAYSNMAQLKMLSDQRQECIFWAEKAIDMALELKDEETLSHALNNIGSVHARAQSSRQNGIEQMQRSLEIALRNNFEEHAARAYINLGSNAVQMKDYAFAKKMLEKGIAYCEERDLDVAKPYLLSSKARMELENGNWNEAYQIADELITNRHHSPSVRISALLISSFIKMRRGERDEVIPLLSEAKEKAFQTAEHLRIIEVTTSLLEYEWITGINLIDEDDLSCAKNLIQQTTNLYQDSEFAFWLLKARNQKLFIPELYQGYNIDTPQNALKAAELWKQLKCPFQHALLLFEGTDVDKRDAMAIIDRIGAKAIYEKMRSQMRALSVKGIPRGIRKSTSSNPANLTTREVDVLQLLGKGLTNRKIADMLFISPKTVDRHITSIFFKLDVTSRALALEQALNLHIIEQDSNQN